MYTILGSDQKEYGPVSPEDLRRWVADGRANSGTLVRVEGSSEWRPLAQFAEFADLLPPPLPPREPPAIPPTTATDPTASQRTNGMALASLILGVLGILTCGLTALVGLILGIVALRKMGGGKDTTDRGLAIAGTIVSAIFLLLLPLFAAIMLPSLASAKQRATISACMNNTKHICLALLMYANDNDETFPQGTNWCDAIRQYTGGEGVFKCPQGLPTERAHYGFNQNLSGLAMQKVKTPAITVLVFETTGGWNSSGGADLLLAKPRHATVSVGFADGHCEAVQPARFSALRWEP